MLSLHAQVSMCEVALMVFSGRRLKKDVLSQLPSKNRQMVILDPGSVKITKNIKASHKMVDRMKGQDRRYALLEYFHDTAAAKVPAIT